ncbi:MAG: phospholipase D-like domain-containing protein [Sulfolobaceae archaeon]
MIKKSFILIFVLLINLVITIQLKSESETSQFSYLISKDYEILVSPLNSTKILDYLNNAKKAIYIEVYVMTYYPLAELLANKSRHGIQVFVVLSRDVYGEIPSSEYDVTDYLKRNGVNVSFLDTKFKYVHSKVYVIDNQTVIVSTQNPTYSGFFRDLGVSIVIRNSTIATWFATIILNDHRGYFPAYNYPGIIVSPLNSYYQLKGLLSINESSVYIAMEELYNSSELVSYILLHNNKYVVVDRSDLVTNWIRVKENLTAKLIVIGDYVYVGSINLSYSSIFKNRELGVIIKDPNLANALKSLILSWYGVKDFITTSSIITKFDYKILFIILLLLFIIIFTIIFLIKRIF